MREVIVSGRVVYTDDGRALVPASLDPESRADCAITLTGADLPPPDCNASARGNLVDQRLAVSEWSLDPDPHPANVPLSGLPGADPAAVDQALATSPWRTRTWSASAPPRSSTEDQGADPGGAPNS